MVSTYLSYDLVTRNIKTSLERVGQTGQAAREAEYYKNNIGKVTTVEEFMDDDRLYNYAMTAHGLEDMTYAKGFMKKVLESDLSDQDSYANKLTDDRYRNFAAAFNFGNGGTKAAQSNSQQDEIVGLYKQSVVNEGERAEAESRYFTAISGTIDSVDTLLGNERARNYVLDAFGINRDNYSYTALKNILTSDIDDPNSYVNTLTAKTDSAKTTKAAYQSMVTYFNFNADGSVDGSMQTDTQLSGLIEGYVLNVPSQITPAAAKLNVSYFDTAMENVTSVTDITGNSRLFAFVKTAFGLGNDVTTQVFKNIVTSDLNDPANYAKTKGGDAWVALAGQFNFQTDGTVAAGEKAMDAAALKQTANAYYSTYDDAAQEAQDKFVATYKKNIVGVTSVDGLLKDTQLLAMTLRAFDINAGELTASKLKKVLTSDINDPNSYANKTKDQRLIKMAQAFNFDAKGNIETPLMAQSEATMTDVAKSYIVNKTRFVDAKDKETVRAAADKEAEYYQENVAKLKTSGELLKDRRLVDFVLEAKGIDPKSVDSDFLKQLFASDLDDPKSFANSQQNEHFAEIVASFNFDKDGKLTRDRLGTVQQGGEVLETANKYLHQTLETQQGEDNAGVRLALYFSRMSDTVTSAYDVLGDPALLEVFKTLYSLPDEISNMDIEQQAKIVNKNLTLSDLKDPEKLDALVKRFTILYDLGNSGGASSALDILSGGNSGGISADTLMAISQYRLGG